MRNYFILDGKSSTDFHTWIASSDMFDGAEHDDSAVEVPGRNGSIIFSNHRYKNYKGKLTCYIPNDMLDHIDYLRGFLSTRTGYCRYEEALRPEEYRMVRFTGGFSVDRSDRRGASFTLKFDCMPQRWHKRGEIPVSYSAAGKIYNSTEFDARPLIKCTGTAGTVTIGGVSVSVTGCTSYVILDCEDMEAYEGSVSRNSTTTLTNGEFPVIKPGVNDISFTGFSKVEVTPRFWTI